MSKYRILVVEDDSDLLQVLVDVFSPMCERVFAAANGEEAYKIVLSESVDLVISDVQMPIMNGFDLLKKIKSYNPEIPIVLLVTGHADVDREMALNAGAADLLHKPFKFKELKKTIEALLAQLKK